MVAAALGAGFAAALASTWVGMRLAPRVGLVAVPRDDRWHRRPTPLLGGLGLVVGFLVGGAVATSATPISGRLIGCLASGVAIAFAVGVADDLGRLGLGSKLVGQLSAAAMLTAGGVGFGDPLPTALDAALTVILLLAVMNAVNLLDNMDGAAAGVACVGLVGLVCVTVVAGAGGSTALLPGVAACACAGYLAWNLPLPHARVFMGDGGSLPLGLALGTLTLLVARGLEGQGGITRLLPFAVLFIPALDSAIVTITRRRAGVRILLGGKDHLAHRLVRHGLSERRSLGVLLLGAAGAAGVAVLAAALTWPVAMLAAGALLVVVFVLLVGRLVGDSPEPDQPSFAGAGERPGAQVGA